MGSNSSRAATYDIHVTNVRDASTGLCTPERSGAPKQNKEARWGWAGWMGVSLGPTFPGNPHITIMHSELYERRQMVQLQGDDCH